MDGEPVITDFTGYQLDLRQAWVTAIECVGWLSIVLLSTFVLMLQNAGIYESGWIRSANTLQYVAYANLSDWRDELKDKQVTAKY